MKASKDSGFISRFELNDKRPSLGSIRLSGKSPLSHGQVIPWLKNHLKLRNGNDDLRSDKTEKNKNNIELERVQQYFKGIKVEHGKIHITSNNGKAAFIQMEFYSIPGDVSAVTGISEQTALQKAIAFVGAEKYMWEGYTGDDPDFIKPTAELVFVEDIYKKQGTIVLAYKFMIYAERPLSKSLIYVSAQTGEIVFTDKIIKHVNASGVADSRYSNSQAITTSVISPSKYILRAQRNGDSIVTLDYQRRVLSSQNQALASDFSDNDNNWTAAEFNNSNFDNAALDVHFGLEKVSDYWKFVHGRNGWNNNHGKMKSYVHVRASANAGYDNAFWDGTAMFYGDGTALSGNPTGFLPLTSIDVTAHELGHAICQSTAGLVYQRESGALNEGFSDIWAACIERYAAFPGLKQTFKIGEEISPPGRFLRDMQSPNGGGQPDTYLGTYWMNTTLGGCPFIANNNDNCGVHYNSGVLNKWFYILTQGESGVNDISNSYQVTGIGFSRSEQIVYLTEQSLTANADFFETRNASINAASVLYGECSAEVIAVTNAWHAVGVGTTADCTSHVEFVSSQATVTEGSGVSTFCASKSLAIPVKLGKAASQPVIINFNGTGTAVNGLHYTITQPNLTFNAGESGTKNFIITLHDNATVDGNKTLSLNYTVASNDGNAIAGLNNQQYTLTIADDDIFPTAVIAATGVTAILINENFESVTGGFPAGWVAGSFSASPSSNHWTVGSGGGAGISGQAAYITSNLATKTFTYNNTSATDKILVTKPVSATGLKELKLQFRYKVEGEYGSGNVYDFGRVMYSTDGSSFQFLNDPSTGQPVLLYGKADVVNTMGPITLPSALNGVKTLYIGFRWISDDYAGTNGPLLVDDVLLTGRTAAATVETLVNQPVTTRLVSGNLSSYLLSQADSQLIAHVSNPSASVSCITASVLAAGTGKQQLTTASGTFHASQKVIGLQPAVEDNSTTYTGTLYFTSQELATWGTSVSNLKILKVKNGVPLSSTLTSENAMIITPTSIADSSATTGVIAFTGNFSGFSKFLLVEPGFTLGYSLSAGITKTFLTCPGDANGSITAAGNGGLSPYSYSIDTGRTFQTSGTFNNLRAGNYQIIVRDNNQQEVDTVVTIGVNSTEWIGGTDSNWHLAANWSRGFVPDASTHVIFPAGALRECIISTSDATAATVQIKAGASLKVNTGRNLVITGKCPSL